jgi:DNA polymerase III epsilon subunit-like protein
MRGADHTLCRPSTPVIVAPLRFLDLETSKLRADRGGRITEIALIDRHAPRIDWTWEEEPGTEAHDRAVRQQLADLVRLLAAGVVVAHNVAFDLEFIAYEARRLGVSGLSAHRIDTLALARQHYPDLSNHQLGTLADALDLPVPGPLHVAHTDALVTRSLFLHLADTVPLQTLGDAGLRRIQWSSP